MLPTTPSGHNGSRSGPIRIGIIGAPICTSARRAQPLPCVNSRRRKSETKPSAAASSGSGGGADSLLTSAHQRQREGFSQSFKAWYIPTPFVWQGRVRTTAFPQPSRQPVASTLSLCRTLEGPPDDLFNH